ncbi:solute carrier family 22 member 7 [Rhipicephalus sanguineus]|nr:solute carrier family 22 member 7 [Rhipicephalus sanguineus]
MAASADAAHRDQGSGALKGFVVTSSLTAIEDNTHVILGNGWYQIRILVASVLATAMMLTQALAYEVIGRPVDHWCRPPADLRDMPANVWRNAAIPVDVDGHFSQCTMYDPPIAENGTEERDVLECREWDYASGGRADSVISRWDLVCERRWLFELSVIVVMLAVVAFAPASGALSDQLGRRPVILIAAGILFIASLCMAFAETLPFFVVARFLASGSSYAMNMIIFVLLFETVGKEQRTLYLVWGTGIGITVSLPLLKAIGALQPRWALAHAVFALPVALLILLCYSVEESPSWLISTSQIRKAERTMLIIAKENGVDMEKARVSLRLLRDQIRQQGSARSNSSTGLLKSDTAGEVAVRLSVFRRQVASVVICFSSLTFLFYALLIHEKPTSIYHAAAYTALQCCIYFTACQVMGKKGERETLTAMLVILCLSAATYAVAQLLDVWSALPHLRSLVLAMCPPCISVAHAYTLDVCPISIRSTALCLAYSCGRVGAVLGVISAKKVKEVHPLALSVAITVMVIVSAGAIQWLPEVFIKRSPNKPLESNAMTSEERKAALKESIASSTRSKKSRRRHSPRRLKTRSTTGSPESVDVGSNAVKQVASPALSYAGKS